SVRQWRNQNEGMRCTRIISRFVCFPVFCLIVANTALAKGGPKLEPGASRIRQLVEELRTQLGIPNAIRVTVVGENQYAFSVRQWRNQIEGMRCTRIISRFVCFPVFCLIVANTALAKGGPKLEPGASRIRQLVEELRTQLGIPNAIRVTVVGENQYAFSVQ